ncbi:hypothetical protein [Gordonia oryzae]
MDAGYFDAAFTEVDVANAGIEGYFSRGLEIGVEDQRRLREVLPELALR